MKIFITGVSGYIGTATARKLVGKHEVFGIDIVEPKEDIKDKIVFRKIDVRSREIEELIKDADIVIHLAFVLNPPKDREYARSVNIDGTRNILSLSKNAKQVIVTTSASAYGALPDNPLMMKEDFPLRGDRNKGFWYSEDKAQQDRLVQEFLRENTHIKVAILRPAIVFGENVKNFIADGFFNPPVVSIFTTNIPFQFIYEEDVADAILKAIEEKVYGPFNLSGEGLVTLKDGAKIMGKPTVKVPFFLQRPLFEIMRLAGVLDRNLPYAVVDFFRYPWVLDTEKAEKVMGFRPKVSSEEAFRKAWKAYKKRKEKKAKEKK